MVTRLKHSTLIILLSILLSAVFCAAFSVWSANRVASQTGDQTVCEIVKVQIDVFNETPPQTSAGKNLQARYVQLYRQKCM